MGDSELIEPATTAREDLESPLIDLSELTLDAIAGLRESVLGGALRRVQEAAGRADDLFITDYDQAIM